jgi:hypothetical protein
MLESVIQSQCVKWFRLHYQQYAHLFFKIDNEGQRSPKRASIALAMGLVSGIPDMFLSVPSRVYHGAYFEFKAPGGKLSQKQKDRIMLLKLQGYIVNICSSEEEFQEQVRNYFQS